MCRPHPLGRGKVSGTLLPSWSSATLLQSLFCLVVCHHATYYSAVQCPGWGRCQWAAQAVSHLHMGAACCRLSCCSSPRGRLGLHVDHVGNALLGCHPPTLTRPFSAHIWSVEFFPKQLFPLIEVPPPLEKGVAMHFSSARWDVRVALWWPLEGVRHTSHWSLSPSELRHSGQTEETRHLHPGYFNVMMGSTQSQIKHILSLCGVGRVGRK